LPLAEAYATALEALELSKAPRSELLAAVAFPIQQPMTDIVKGLLSVAFGASAGKPVNSGLE
jgi:hypothetical protein